MMKKSTIFLMTIFTIISLQYACQAPTCEASYPEGKDLDFMNQNNEAMNGLDVISFLNLKEGIMGQDTITSTHNGVTYNFARSQNKKLFDSNAEKYMPQIGGYCVVAASMGKVEEVDLKNFGTYKGKLFFATNEKALKMWNADKEKITEQAYRMWPCLVDKKGRNLN